MCLGLVIGGKSMETSKKLHIEELKLGMQVRSSQLSNIFNTYIILINTKISDDGQNIIGEIAFIGAELNSKSDEINKKYSNKACIFNSDDTCDGEIYYEE